MAREFLRNAILLVVAKYSLQYWWNSKGQSIPFMGHCSYHKQGIFLGFKEKNERILQNDEYEREIFSTKKPKHFVLRLFKYLVVIIVLQIALR